ncbi:MAG: tetratricopeptide repeat protein [Geobacteraceae bacterium]|nr:tetratricopeptide repeat protein [Geobacteraceae bacterium]
MKRTKKISATAAVSTETGGVKPLLPEPGNRSLWQDPFVHILLILAAGFVVYFNSINVPFMFDDYDCLVKNPVIRSFDCFPDTRKVFEYAIDQDIKNNLILRPAAYFTFAVNYALHGLDLFGYHIVNLLLHIGCAMLVYRFFVQLLEIPAMSNEENTSKACGLSNSGYLPLFAALLFVCHPLQTQAVTYIIQRFVPLATFFYLAALVLYGEFRRAATSGARILTYLLSLAAAVLAMESKEIAFTLPILICLVELMFFRGDILPRAVRLIPFLLTMMIIPAKLMHLSSPVTPEKTESISSAINLVNFGGISSGDYLMSQFGVITTYLRLLFLPIRQNLDYDYPLQQSFFKSEVLLPLALLLMVAGIGFSLLKRSGRNPFYKIIAFGIFWFFITLSVESSIVPINDLIFEQRAYLPSIGFFISALAAAAVIFHRWTRKSIEQSKVATGILLSILLGLSSATIDRNMLWQDDAAFWRDVVKKSPNKARAHRWLGWSLLQQSRYVSDDKSMLEGMMLLKAGSENQISAAISAFNESIRIEPNNPTTHRLLAEALMLQKDYDAALRSLATAAELQPKSALPYAMRGEVFEAKKDITRARQEYLEAIRIDPSYHMPHLKLANLYTNEGNTRAAIKEFEFVMRVFPDESVRKKLERLMKR